MEVFERLNVDAEFGVAELVRVLDHEFFVVVLAGVLRVGTGAGSAAIVIAE